MASNTCSMCESCFPTCSCIASCRYCTTSCQYCATFSRKMSFLISKVKSSVCEGVHICEGVRIFQLNKFHLERSLLLKYFCGKVLPTKILQHKNKKPQKSWLTKISRFTVYFTMNNNIDVP